MKKTIKLACTAVLIALSASVQADNANADQICEVVTKSINSTPEKVTDIVFEQVLQNPSSACEIVKAAIVASKADKDLVADIVAAATEAAPDKITIIGQCAMAVAPDALAEVQAVFVKLAATAAGDLGGSKGGFGGGKTALPEIPLNPIALSNPANPLEFPGQGAVGPTPGGPGGFPLFPPGLQPPTIVSNPVTTPDTN